MIIRQAAMARCAALLLLAWMFFPLLTGRVYVCDDLLNYHLPVRSFYAECLARGDAFDWMPGLFGGFFLTGSGQAGTYHPWHWLLYRFFPLPTAFNLEILSSYPFMLFGMKLFLERQLRRPDAAWLGAIVFTFSGFCTLHFLHPNAVAVISHLAWLLLAQSVLLQTDSDSPYRSRRRLPAALAVVLLTGSQLLLGYPQYVWYSILAEICFCLGFVSWSWRGVRVLTLLALLKIAGLALGAVQILPSLDGLAESDRSDLPAEYFYQDPLTLGDMLQWTAPYLTRSRVWGLNTHELGVYCGAIPLLLAAAAVVRIRSGQSDARLIRTAAVLGVTGLWLSFGKSGGLYLLQTWLPLVGKFRWPSRIVVLMHFSIAILAAAGYVKLLPSEPKAVVRFPRSLMLLPAVSVLATLFAGSLFEQEKRGPLSLVIIGPVLFCLAAVMVRDLARGRISAGFMLFVAGDLAAYGFTYEALNRTQTMDQVFAELHAPPGSPENGRIIAETHVSRDGAGFGGNQLQLAGWRQADGYDGLLPKTRLLDRNISLDGLRILGVKWVVNSGLHDQIPGLQPARDPRWLEVPQPLPRFRLTGQVREVTDVAQAAVMVSAAGPVLVDRPLPVSVVDDFSDAAVSPDVDRPGDIRLTTRCSSPKLLVISERFSSGWIAEIDGVSVPIARADADLMGCGIPAGTHSVQFRFAPASLDHGRKISLTVVILLALAAATSTIARSVRGRAA